MDESNPAVVKKEPTPTIKEATVKDLLDELCFRGEAFVAAIYQYHAGKKDPSYTAWRCIGPGAITMGLVRTLEKAAEYNFDCEPDGDEEDVSESEVEDEDDEDAEFV